MKKGFAVAEVQINEIDTPLHKLETVYRRSIESLRTATIPPSALRPVLDAWLFTIDDDARQQGVDADTLLERRLADVAARAPVFPLAIRAYRRMVADGDHDGADGLVAWLGGQPHVAAAVKRRPASRAISTTFSRWAFCAACWRSWPTPAPRAAAGARRGGDAATYPQRRPGQGAQRVTPTRRRNSRRPFPWPLFVDNRNSRLLRGRQGIPLLPPLADRLHTEFAKDPRFDNPRAPQLRLTGFDQPG
ncbi:hypothetical protein I553_9737 [Mycobacterium xenopi 4042]|uniref:Uncharacterized protein n=1 Tax=Mycobacterium xenopi 4042 TaxID=1299334 RepID=X7YPG6_MYCXE|nr:hypothetical protein I553_9737 [Mycobacterium xenopi 4042]